MVKDCPAAALVEHRCQDLMIAWGAEQIERDQKEIAELKAKVDQYRALIPSWVIPMVPKEDADGTTDL